MYIQATHAYKNMYIYLTFININPIARVHALKKSVMTEFFPILLSLAPSYGGGWCPVSTETRQLEGQSLEVLSVLDNVYNI